MAFYRAVEKYGMNDHKHNELGQDVGIVDIIRV